ncbi:MAG: hypothetical protein NT131_05300 [Methanomassiliicoccales archaeon]|nr:hypothetical protein [Methanomassiliicoccales archaeon]
MRSEPILPIPGGKSFFLEYLSVSDIKMEVRYEVLGEEGLDLIGPLWL